MNQTFFNIELKEQTKNTVCFQLKKGAQQLSFQAVFELWQSNSAFVEFYTEALIQFGFEAFYWEHPALKKEFLHQPYECTVQRSQPLEQLPINERAFKDYIHSEEQVVDFRNIGKDARLVVPTKQTNQAIYNHLGRFIRLAAQQQIIATFNRIGSTVLEEIDQQKLIWLNTAGLGVIWLHIRMDTRPKYYKTTRYKASIYS